MEVYVALHAQCTSNTFPLFSISTFILDISPSSLRPLNTPCAHSAQVRLNRFPENGNLVCVAVPFRLRRRPVPPLYRSEGERSGEDPGTGRELERTPLTLHDTVVSL